MATIAKADCLLPISRAGSHRASTIFSGSRWAPQCRGLPVFPGLRQGGAPSETRFDILDADHHTIHEGLERNAEAANAFIRTLQESEDKQRFAADAYADENSRLIAMLTRHLADEEDLIIPLILDRGDRALGID
ncbi:hypothetical protein [Mesorhizobium sp. M8A.F.Ca.ET.021.01.1.1]|uniref:hypothetical protein n=1 Tax=Mesorhizobium sp. M8A.F.Ca.ET.021.01.1.1 TaxID=2496757 RepID=UPI001FE134B0|nr:hypothetical protein [Mesorhizobium sp. M8A.F.Ca.ET.021.01.1.1]